LVKGASEKHAFVGGFKEHSANEIVNNSKVHAPSEAVKQESRGPIYEQLAQSFQAAGDVTGYRKFLQMALETYNLEDNFKEKERLRMQLQAITQQQ
jgi:hypothetical protein